MSAAIYARYSSENQREESIEAQIRAIKDYAKKNNIEIIKIYYDEAKSGTTDDRPQFLQMIKDSSLKLFDLLIVHKLDRFARNRYDSAIYRKKLKDNGVKLISVVEHLDDSPESIILESVLEGMAEYYSVNLAREVMKGLKENALKCEHCGGIPPLGYDVVNKKYVINQKEAEIVKFIFNEYSDGYGYKQIVKLLNEKGYTTKRGKLFNPASLHDLLRNEKYIGTYTFNLRNDKQKNSHKFKDNKSIIKIPNGIPAIIDADTFKKIQEKMNGRKMNARFKAKQVYLLSGKIFCGKCNSTMISHTSHSNGKKYSSYICGTRYRNKNCDMKPVEKEYAENIVVKNLKENIFNPKSISDLKDKLIKQYSKMKAEKNNDLKMFNKKLNEIQNKMDKMVNAVADGFYNPTMKNKMNELEEEKNQILIYINEIKEFQDKQELDSNLIEKYLYKDMEALNNNNVNEIKNIIDTYVDKIIVYDDRIDAILSVHTNGSPKGN